MYTYGERMKAVQLYIKYNHSLATVIAELGYPHAPHIRPLRKKMFY